MPIGYFLLVFRGGGEPIGSDEVGAERGKNVYIFIAEATPRVKQFLGIALSLHPHQA